MRQTSRTFGRAACRRKADEAPRHCLLPVYADENRRTFEDRRGKLHAFQAFDNLPFTPQRVFLIEVGAGTIDRSGHANSCDEVIVVLQGSVTVELDHGEECDSIRLFKGGDPLWKSAGVMIRLTKFAPDSTVLVCASERSPQTLHYPEPQAHLILEGPVA